MEKIVSMPGGGRVLFEGTRVPDAWEVFTWSANGVLERSARPVIEWREVCEINPVLDACGNPVEPAEPTPEELEEKRRKAALSAARRAKTMCRRVIITEGFDELLTLTYRENQTDRALCKRHFEAWYRRMKRALGGFRFCASFERQERGAMHVHIATHKLPEHAKFKGVKVKAWELGTRIWRDIVGADNGLCFVGGRSRWGGRRRNMSLAKMAAYVSKYILKDFEDSPLESNRYSRSNGVVVGEIHRMTLRCTLAELLDVTFEAGEGDVVIAHRVSKWKDGMWFCTEGPRDGPDVLR